MKTIELFGNIYEEVESNGLMSECKLCALRNICMTTPELPCKKADGSTNRRFVLVNEKLIDEEK